MILARINVDISLADFEAGVRNLVSDTEKRLLGTGVRLAQLGNLEHGLEQCPADVEENSLAVHRGHPRW